MWKKVFQYFLRRFQITQGRSPMNAAEMNQIQSEAVNWINKTGGKTLPGTPKSQKPPFQGWTPKVIEGGKGKAGIGTLLKDSPEAIAKIKAENKAAIERLKAKKKTVEDFRDEGDFDPGGMASGGIARAGYAGGKLVKGASWVIKNLRKSRQEVIEGKGQFSKLNPMEQESLKWELSALIKQLERGGKIPDDMLQTMRQDKRFKDIVKTPSTDPELRELEEVLLGKTDMDRMRDIEQKINLEDFDVTGKTRHASGGIARVGFAEGKTYKDWLNYRLKEIAKRRLPTPFKEWKKGEIKMASGGIAGELRLNQGGRIGYAEGTKKLGEGQYSPTKDKAWMQTMPMIDPNLRELMKEYKKRKGLAEILGV